MNYEQDNPELRYAQKFEKFETNPYASDGWDDIAREYSNETLESQEEQKIMESLEQEKPNDEISSEDIADAHLEYFQARQRDQQLKSIAEQEAIGLGEIQKNYQKIRSQGIGDHEEYEIFSGNIDPTFAQKQIENYKINRGESLKNLNPLEQGSKIIDDHGNFREATSEEIANSERLSELAFNPDDKNLYQAEEDYIVLAEKQAERATQMQDEVNRYENPNIFVKATNLIPFVKEGREKDHEQRMDNLNQLTAEEQEIINQDPYLNQTIENKIHSGNWHDSAM